MLLKLPDDSVNDQVRDGLRETIKLARNAHYTDVVVRIGGEDRRMEADWIKYLEIEPE